MGQAVYRWHRLPSLFFAIGSHFSDCLTLIFLSLDIIFQPSFRHQISSMSTNTEADRDRLESIFGGNNHSVEQILANIRANPTDASHTLALWQILLVKYFPDGKYSRYRNSTPLDGGSNVVSLNVVWKGVLNSLSKSALPLTPRIQLLSSVLWQPIQSHSRSRAILLVSKL